MFVYCPKCHARKTPVEENSLACPKCDVNSSEIPQLCDYCHEHVASMPSDDGAWICDYCIVASLVGPTAMAQVLAVQANLERSTSNPVPVNEALAEWRRLASAVKVPPASPAEEVNAHAT